MLAMHLAMTSLVQTLALLVAVALPTAPATPAPRGLVVWESNRTGDWRIWMQRLDGGGLAQLTPEEPGRQHCCAHLSPDGKRLVYLARVGGREAYFAEEVAGELRLLRLADGASRVVAPRARTYGWGNRSAVWRNDRELIHVGGDGRTFLLTLPGAEARPLTDVPRHELGWLIDPTLSYATQAAPSFSPYDPAGRAVREVPVMRGCEPYFTADGEWGYWVHRGGGPLRRMRLADREIVNWIEREDPRLPADQRYIYFPMLSRDRRALVYGASRSRKDHDHFRSDYDVFWVPIDPRSFALQGTPVRVTRHPASDRYPDIYLEP